MSDQNNDENAATIMEAAMLAALAGSDAGAGVDPTLFRRTDAGNADLFVAMFGEDLRFVEVWGKWKVWDGTRWIEASDLALVPFAKEATEHMLRWASTLPEGERTEWRKHALASQRRERLRAMIDLAKGDAKVRAEPNLFDADPLLLGCGGVTIDLRGKQPKAYRPKREDYITNSTGIVPNPKADCPEWREFLDWAFDGDVFTIEHMQRIAGYLLTGSVREEKLFAFFGGGANGKTTFVRTVAEMLGDYAGSARGTLLMELQGEKGAASPDVAALRGKRLVVVSETDEQCTLAEAQVKTITSNEPIRARDLYSKLFTFMPTHKTILTTNHRPFVKGTDDGIWRRLNIVGFKQQIATSAQVKDFRETRLRPELPAILAWAIQGYYMYQRDGLKPSPAVSAATAAYRSDMDYMAEWLDERTVPDPKARCSRTAAYDDYRAWAQAERRPVLGAPKFGEELDRRGHPTLRSHGKRHVSGLRLKLPDVTLQLIQGGVGRP